MSTQTAPTTRPPARRGGGGRPGRADIQGLRALAVVAVLVYHAFPAALPGGYVGVDIFFVISGFVITSLMLTELIGTGRLGFANFYARRARRILPAATATLIAVVLGTLAFLPINRWGTILGDAVATSVFGINWRLAGASVDYLQGGSAVSPLQHYWSLGIEEQFYFVWPLVLVGAVAVTAKIVRARRDTPIGERGIRIGAATVLGAIIAVSLVESVTRVGASDPAAYFVTTTRAWQLGVGALLAVAWPAVNRLTGNTAAGLAEGNARRRWASRILGVSGAGCVGYALVAFSGQTPFPGWASALPTLGTALLIATGRPAAAWVRSRPVQWLGAVSYSLYLVHWPLAVFLPAGNPVVGGAVIIAGSLVLAHLSYTYVEQGTLGVLDGPRLTRRVPGRSRRALAAGATAILTGVAVTAAAAGVWTATVTGLNDEAAQILADAPPELGAGSLHPGDYDNLLAGRTGTVPSRSAVREDLPESHQQGCQGAATDRRTPECVYGAETATVTWVLVGDSHADQYLPALTEIAADRGIRLVTLLQANCPFTAAQRDIDVEPGGPCRAANADRLTRILDLAPDVVITSNWTGNTWTEDLTPEDGFAQFWSQIEAPVLVLSDNPVMLGGDRTTECVLATFPETGTCDRPRPDALPVDHQLDPARTTAGVHLIDTTDLFCTQAVCPPVIGSVMVYRDSQHITATYMATLVPELAAALDRSGVTSP